jgi:hypothetical protein
VGVVHRDVKPANLVLAQDRLRFLLVGGSLGAGGAAAACWLGVQPLVVLPAALPALLPPGADRPRWLRLQAHSGASSWGRPQL